MSKTLPSTYTVDRLRILYRVFLDKYGFMRPHILAFLNWLDAQGDKIEENSPVERI